ncbi:MAG TPA: haloacid dehalogenase-like hydrolase [Methylomirabilota bacterium]|nr:haloacid dehalogenase-like hydrolase [Methylomirabilota bacterium]
MRLFLFDVDGTLVTARGAGRAAITHALRATYGTAGDVDAYDFRGRTDGRIVWDLMRGAGLADAVIARGLPACYAAYVDELTRVIGDGARVQVMPGIPAVVRALAARDDALVGLLTGNIEAGARVKLASTGLWPLFRVGAFGSDDVDRRRLPAIACERARAVAGREFPFERVTIIGDTPLDVDCARACGAIAVAVATGFHPHAELAACAPDHLFIDFADVAGTLATLTGAR